MTSRSDDDSREQLQRAQAMIDALGRTLYAATVERDNLRAEVDAAKRALGSAWTRGTLADGITAKSRWLEAMIGQVEQANKVR